MVAQFTTGWSSSTGVCQLGLWEELLQWWSWGWRLLLVLPLPCEKATFGWEKAILRHRRGRKRDATASEVQLLPGPFPNYQRHQQPSRTFLFWPEWFVFFFHSLERRVACLFHPSVQLHIKQGLCQGCPAPLSWRQVSELRARPLFSRFPQYTELLRQELSLIISATRGLRVVAWIHDFLALYFDQRQVIKLKERERKKCLGGWVISLVVLDFWPSPGKPKNVELSAVPWEGTHLIKANQAKYKPETTR